MSLIYVDVSHTVNHACVSECACTHVSRTEVAFGTIHVDTIRTDQRCVSYVCACMHACCRPRCLYVRVQWSYMFWMFCRRWHLLGGTCDGGCRPELPDAQACAASRRIIDVAQAIGHRPHATQATGHHRPHTAGRRPQAAGPMPQATCYGP